MQTFIIRPENPADHRAVESLTREAFWNLHKPGCDEHLLAHNLRLSPAFLPGLDFVAQMDDTLVGSILYSQSHILTPAGVRIETVTFGPLSVLPEHQGQGIGGALVHHSLAAARAQGHRAVVIFGHPGYYPRFGFRPAAAYGVTTAEGESFDAFMALELLPGALAEAGQGRFFDAPVFTVDPAEVEQFDKNFPQKEKGPARQPLAGGPENAATP